MKSNKFHCDKCGECCRHVDRIAELKYLDGGDGVCVNLKNNLCAIYDHRPAACNVNKMYELSYKDSMTLEEYYDLNYRGCQGLKSENK